MGTTKTFGLDNSLCFEYKISNYEIQNTIGIDSSIVTTK